MAKNVGLIGSVSGKVGNVVYAVTNGIQTVRAYQPVISNPKTRAQNIQRAKMNLIGRVSQITPKEVLMGLGSNARRRRSRFLSLGLNATTTASEGGNIVAKLDAPDFIFSEGALAPAYFVSTATASNAQVSVTIQRLAGVSDAIVASSGVLLVLTLLNTNGRYEEVLYRYLTASNLSNETTVVIYHSQIGDYECGVYLAPFATVDGSSMSQAFKEMKGEGADFTAILENNPNTLPLVWGRSILQREINYSVSYVFAGAAAAN